VPKGERRARIYSSTLHYATRGERATHRHRLRTHLRRLCVRTSLDLSHLLVTLRFPGCCFLQTHTTHEDPRTHGTHMSRLYVLPFYAPLPAAHTHDDHTTTRHALTTHLDSTHRYLHSTHSSTATQPRQPHGPAAHWPRSLSRVPVSILVTATSPAPRPSALLGVPTRGRTQAPTGTWAPTCTPHASTHRHMGTHMHAARKHARTRLKTSSSRRASCAASPQRARRRRRWPVCWLRPSPSTPCQSFLPPRPRGSWSLFPAPPSWRETQS